MKKLTLVNKDVRRESRSDGWQNLVTLLGTSADKRTGARISWELREPEFYEQLYAGGGIPARIVDIVPDSALREGWDWLNIPKERKEEFNDRCEALDLRTGIGKTWKWGRAYGGACLHIVTDTSDPASPLRRGERVLGLRDLSRWDVRVLTTDIEYDFGSPNWGHPRLYYLNVQMGSQYKSYPIHWTRMIRFDGQLVPRRTYIRNNYWHDSVLNRLYDTIRDYQTSNDAAASCLQDFNVDVIKLKNLAAMIGAGEEQKVKDRIDMMQYSKSTINAMIIDADMEEYDNKGRAMEGVAELLTKQENRLVAETDIPHTILLGESPDGSNATGNSTSQAWYNFISSEQRNYLAPKLKRLIQILFAEEPKLSFKFNPLRKLDALEEAKLKADMAETDSKYIASGVLDPTEVANSRFGGEEYSTDTELDEEARAAGLIGAPGMPGGDPNDPNGGGGLPPQTDAQGNELAPGDPGTSPQGFEPPAALLMQEGEEQANLAASSPDADQPGKPGEEPGGLEQGNEGATSPVDPGADPAEQQAAAQEQGTPEAAVESDPALGGVEEESDPDEAAILVEGEKSAAQDEVPPFPAAQGVQGGKPDPKALQARKDAFGSPQGSPQAKPPGKPAPGKPPGGPGKPGIAQDAPNAQSKSSIPQDDPDAANDESGSSDAPPESEPKTPLLQETEGGFGVTPPSSHEEAAQLESELATHTEAMMQALSQAQTPEERQLVRQSFQETYAEYQKVMAKFMGGAPAPGAEPGEEVDPDADPDTDGDGEDDDVPVDRKDALGAVEGQDDDGDGIEDAQEPEVPANSAEGQSIRAGMSGGNDFDFRNSKAPAPKNPVPAVSQMITQMMSEPMRDPRTDPRLPGPGTPKRHRTILPTRGTGMTAPSGSDPALDAGAKDGELREEARQTKQDAAWSESKHKRAQGGKFGSGGGGGAKSKPKPKGAGPKVKAKPKAKPPGEKEGKPVELGAPDPVEAGAAILEKLKEQAERGDSDNPIGGAVKKKRAACVIVRKGDKFLMGRRRDREGGKWALPGGHVERHESHHQGAIRELLEETGFAAKRLKFLGGRMVEPAQGMSVHINLYEHKVEDAAQATGRLDPDKEFAEYRWVHISNQLPEDIAGNLAHPNNVGLLHLGLLK